MGTPVRKRQQMPSPSHFKVDLSHHSNILHANKKVKHVFHILQKLSDVFNKNAFKWLLLSFLLVWLVGIAVFASSSTSSSDIQGNQVELNVTRQFSSVLDLQSITTIQERFEKMKILSDKQKYILGNLSKNLSDMKLNKLP